MLEAAPKHFLSNDFEIRSSGRTITSLDVSLWRERAEFELDGVSHRLYRDGLMSGAFVIERAGFVIARAMKPSAFRSRFDVDIGGRPFTVRKLSMFGRRFGVFSGEQQVGVIRPVGAFTRRTAVELPSDWTPAVQLFVFWLALVIWNREASAAAS